MDNKNSNLTAITKKNRNNMSYWTGAWVAATALATFGPIFLWDFDKTISLIAILFCLAIGVGMIFANMRYINGLDELQRKIQLEAMGIALGVAVVFGLAYNMLDISNVISGNADIAYLVILIGLTYLGGTLIGQRRYK
jgi:hypothetical protein